MKLADSHALVTGASRGIGAAIARQLHERGAKLTLVARDQAKLDALAEEFGGANVLPADLTDQQQLETLVARAEELGGPVDVLVNNAGIDETGLFWEMSADGLRRLIDLNVLAAMELSRQALPGMVGRGRGHIVNMSSTAALGVLPGLAAYSGTKAALSHFSCGLRTDLKGLPVGVTNVQVGFVVPTDMADKADTYMPVARSRQRLIKLGVMPDTDLTKLARSVTNAVERDKRHVLLPSRLAMTAGMVEMPRRMVAMMIGGVPHREETTTETL